MGWFARRGLVDGLLRLVLPVAWALLMLVLASVGHCQTLIGGGASPWNLLPAPWGAVGAGYNNAVTAGSGGTADGSIATGGLDAAGSNVNVLGGAGSGGTVNVNIANDSDPLTVTAVIAGEVVGIAEGSAATGGANLSTGQNASANTANAVLGTVAGAMGVSSGNAGGLWTSHPSVLSPVGIIDQAAGSGPALAPNVLGASGGGQAVSTSVNIPFPIPGNESFQIAFSFAPWLETSNGTDYGGCLTVLETAVGVERAVIIAVMAYMLCLRVFRDIAAF